MPEETVASQPPRGKSLIAWQFPEFPYYRRGQRWYTVAGVVAAAAFVTSIFQKNPLFSVILILLAIIYVMIGQRKPRQIAFAVRESGIEVDRDFYRWEELDQFWIVYHPPEIKKLFFRFTTPLRPALTVQLEKENPVSVRKILLDYLSEDLSGEEPTSDQIGRVLKL